YARIVEEKYRPILNSLKREVADNGWFGLNAVYGFWPCQSQGNDVILYDSPDFRREVQRLTFPRQLEGRRLCIADYFASKDSGRMDVIGLSCVTAGARASMETARLFEAGEYTKYLYLHGLSVETAEALAEFVHKKMREELGIAGDDARRIS